MDEDVMRAKAEGAKARITRTLELSLAGSSKMLQEVINNSNAEVARACGRSLGESSKNLEKVVQTAEAEKDKADMAWARGLSPEEFQNERDYRIKKANSARQKAKQANSETEITEKEKAQGDWERKIEKLIRYYDGPECYHETIYPVTQRVDGQPLVCSWCGKKPDLGTLYACTLDSEPFLEDDYPRNPDKVQVKAKYGTLGSCH